jgi:hypothetical protein
MSGGVQERTVTGTVVDILARISSDGGNVVEIRMDTASGDHKAMAHGERASAAQKLREKIEAIMKSKGHANMKALGVPLEVVGIVKDPTTTVVTAMKISG